VQLDGFGKLQKLNDFIGTRNRDLRACSIAPNVLNVSYYKEINVFLYFGVFPVTFTSSIPPPHERHFQVDAINSFYG
jgi:hypothetical protein